MDDAELERRLVGWRDATLRTTSSGDQPDYRDPRAWTRRATLAAAAAAAVAVVLVAGVSVGVARSRTAAPPTAPVATRTVTYDGVSLDVPAGWSTNGEWCGTPTEDTVLIEDGYVNQCLASPRPVSSVQFSDFPLDGGATPTSMVSTGGWIVVELDGHQARRRDSIVRTERPPGIAAAEMSWPDIVYHRTEIVIDDPEVWVTVQAVAPDIVTTIAATVRISF